MQQGVQEITTSGKEENEDSCCYKRYIAMLRCLGEIFVLILFFFSSYANLQKGALKIQFQPPPVPFLYQNSSVNDFFRGDIGTPFTSVVNSDVSLVMYYAPWDFDSQLTRKVFDQVALKYKDQVYFSAVNCWVQSGECKQIFSKLRSFPVILGYVGGSNGIQFRGPLQFKYIDSFVQQLIKPYDRIESSHDLFRLLVSSTGVVTGYFNFSDAQPQGFYSFYVASLKYLEYDVHRSTRFAVITNPRAASDLGISELTAPSMPYDIRLHLWNETLIYPRNASGVDVGRLLQWIYYRTHSPIQWIWPSGRKSQVIQHYLFDQGRPSLVLFTPQVENSEQYLTMKEVALEYHNCASSSRIARLVQEIKLARHAIEEERLALAKQCSIYESEERSKLFLSNVTKLSCDEASSELKSSGLACRTNKTLNFYLIDSEQYPNFILKLGYSSKDYRPNSNVAVIIDPRGESYYTLKEPLTIKSIQQLIVSFTNRALTPYRRSTSHSKSCSESRLCVESVSSAQFSSVLDPAYDTIVYYLKEGCIFCNAGARTFLRLTQMFMLTEKRHLNSSLREIKFITINTEDNDLPWQFTVDKYPTIVFFPAERKMDSRVFPHELELNLANLLNFTLSQLTLRQRVLWFIQFCKEPACLQEARRQIDAQSFMIDQHIRTLRNRLSVTEFDDASLMQDLRAWMKEQYFYKELEYSVVKTLSDLKLRSRIDMYPDGVKFSYNR